MRAANSPSDGLDARISALVHRYGLSREAAVKLRLLTESLAGDPLAPTAIRDAGQIVDRHLADSLVALELDAVRRATLPMDLGSGAGIPGLPLAAVLPNATFVLLDSSSRKCAFLERTAQACGISNVAVVQSRAESYADGRGRHDLITARAVARLDVVAEYAAPLLQIGGSLVAWGGRRSAELEAAASRAVEQLGYGELEVEAVEPYREAQHRHLYLTSKVRETPPRFPRRPGVAAKRPLGTPR